jgi:hypothetical protein
VEGCGTHPRLRARVFRNRLHLADATGGQVGSIEIHASLSSSASVNGIRSIVSSGSSVSMVAQTAKKSTPLLLPTTNRKDLDEPQSFVLKAAGQSRVIHRGEDADDDASRGPLQTKAQLGRK